MKTNLNIYRNLLFILSGLLIISCSKDEEIVYVTETVTETITVPGPTVTVEVPGPTVTVVSSIEVPYSYEFARNGKSTVAFGGQTTRLKMADELYSALNTNTFTKAHLLEMFNDGTGFSEASLNTSGKKMGNKTAGSQYASATVKPLFDAMITDFADNVIPNWASDASNGQAGKLTDATR